MSDLGGASILANSLNLGYRAQEFWFKVGDAPSCGFSTKSSKIPFNNQWTPYLILMVLLCMKGVLVKERNHSLGKFFNSLQFPAYRWICCSILPSLVNEDAPQVVLNVLKHIGIIISQSNLESKTKFWVNLVGAFSTAMPKNKGSLAIKQTREIVSKVIVNIQILRKTLTTNLAAEGFVDIDVVNLSISFFEGTNLDASYIGDGVITQATFKKFDFLFASSGCHNLTSSIAHNCSFSVWFSPIVYSTKRPSYQVRSSFSDMAKKIVGTGENQSSKT